MILAIGWKNVWRNKTRSLVVIIAVMLGIFGGVMAMGIMQGWIEQRIHASIYNEISHVQIHNPKFMYNEEIQYTIKDYGKITSILDTMSGVVAYSPRVKLFAMAKTAGAATGFTLKGVDAEKEMQVSEIYKNLVEGNFLEGEHRKPSIVIGSETAKNLKLINYQVTQGKLDSINREDFPGEVIDQISKIGAKRFRNENDFKSALKKVLPGNDYKRYANDLAKYFSFYRTRASIAITLQDKEGDLVYPVFRVRGIYKTTNTSFDAMNAFVDREVLNRYTGLSETEVNEIAIISTDNDAGALLAEKLSLRLPEQEVMSWRQLSPELAMYTDFSTLISYIYVIIILFALAFGIINTMMMSVLERIKELGMLMAIGMNKKRVFSLIMTESVFLTLTGAVAGMLFSGIMVAVLSRTGINFSMWSEGFEALGYAAIVYPFVTWQNYAGVTIMVIITGMIASIWPARKALRLNAVEALRTE